jgi:hypothetical protein
VNSLLVGATHVLGVLRAVDPAPEEADVRPGGFYAIMVLGLIAVLVLLWFSLRKQLGRIDVDRANQTPPGGSKGASKATPTGDPEGRDS